MFYFVLLLDNTLVKILCHYQSVAASYNNQDTDLYFLDVLKVLRVVL